MNGKQSYLTDKYAIKDLIDLGYRSNRLKRKGKGENKMSNKVKAVIILAVLAIIVFVSIIILLNANSLIRKK